uniref:RNA-directed DNA polymerase n=1 Tax=Vitis vinifera TaxID=29760 RepID=A5B283_VITVI|nr:hypothetical protein VITISV_033591 [Vitis vinifera]
MICNLIRSLEVISQHGSQLQRWSFNLRSGTRVLAGGFAAVKFSQRKVDFVADFAAVKFSHRLMRLSSNGHNFFVSTPIVHRLKRWTPDFLSFEKTYSMYEMDSRNRPLKQLLETMCGGDFMSKNSKEAMDFLSYVAEVSRGWDEPNAKEVGRMNSQPNASNAKVGMYTLNEVQEKGKFPSQPHQIPKVIYEMEAQEGESSQMREVKAVITLRSGKEVDMPTPKPEQEPKQELETEAEKEKMEENKGKEKGSSTNKEDLEANCKSLTKYKDPGCLTISMMIGETCVEKALLDLGANRSVKIPRGMIEDVLVQVDKFYYPVDFVVLDMDPVAKGPNYIPIILGRPFLATSNAIINCRNRVMQLTFGNMTLELNIFYMYNKQFHPREEEGPEEKMLEDLNENFGDLDEGLSEPLDSLATLPPLKMREEILPLFNEEETQKSVKEEPPKLILKSLPTELKYAYLEENKQSPVVISSSLTTTQEGCLFEILRRCKKKDLVLNWEKFHSMVPHGIILGHIISSQGIEVDKAKVKLIVKLPWPTTVKGVRQFLGHAGFYRRFIKDFSKLARLLCELLVKDAKFQLPFEVMCDANDFSIRAILGQREDGRPYVIYYASKMLNEVQRNYKTTKKELLAVVFALDKFHAYLVGSFIVVFTDHSALKYLLTKQDAKARLIKWILFKNSIFRSKTKREWKMW